MLSASEKENETPSDSEECSEARTIETQKLKAVDYAVEDFVLVLFNGEKYPGRIVRISDEGPTVDCMERGFKFWRWPQKEDSIQYDWDDVLCKIDPPKKMSKRNQFSVHEIDNFV